MQYCEVYLAHHGVLGQKWGVRRYQNPDGTLTPAGRKRLYGNRQLTLEKGTTFDRVSAQNKSDVSKNTDKLYVTASDKDRNLYKTFIGASNLSKVGKAFVQTYLATNDIKIPSVSFQNKLSLKMLKDPEIRQELQDSFMKKGKTREQAAELVENVKIGKIMATNILAYAGMMGAQGATIAIPALATGNPLIAGITTGVGAGVGAAVGTVSGLASLKNAKEDKARTVANALGDKENVKLNATYSKALRDAGYNAYRDYNDKMNRMQSKTAIVIDKPNDAVKLKSSNEMTKSDYAKAYADYKFDNLSKSQKKEISFDSLVKDGEKYYDQLIKEHKISKHNRETISKILAS